MTDSKTLTIIQWCETIEISYRTFVCVCGMNGSSHGSFKHGKRGDPESPIILYFQTEEIIHMSYSSLNNRVYAQVELYAIRQSAYTPRLYCAIFYTSGYENSVTLSYRIKTKSAPPIQYGMKTLWIRSEFISNFSHIVMCLQKFCDNYYVYMVYTYELSSVQVHLFIFSHCDVKIAKRHQ